MICKICYNASFCPNVRIVRYCLFLCPSQKQLFLFFLASGTRHVGNEYFYVFIMERKRRYPPQNYQMTFSKLHCKYKSFQVVAVSLILDPDHKHFFKDNYILLLILSLEKPRKGQRLTFQTLCHPFGISVPKL